MGLLRRWLVVAALLGLGLGARAHAAMQEAALQKFNRGLEALHAKRFADALQQFRASQQLEPSPNTRFQIALCLEAQGRSGSAYSEFRRAAQEAQELLGTTRERRYASTQEAALVRARLLEPRLAWLILLLPPDALPGIELTIDGLPLDPAALAEPLVADPGSHEVRGGGQHLTRFAARIELMAGETRRLRIELERLPQAELRLQLRSRPAGLMVQLDARTLAPAEIEEAQTVDVGRHRVRATAPGHLPFLWERTLTNREVHTVPISLSSVGGARRWLLFASVGGALAALATGIGLTGLARSGRSSDGPLVSAQRLMRQDELRALSTGANIALGFGTALSATALVLGLTTRWQLLRPNRRLRAALVSLPTAHGGVLSVAAGF